MAEKRLVRRVAAALSAGGVILSLLGAAPAHAQPVVKVDDGNGGWLQNVSYADNNRGNDNNPGNDNNQGNDNSQGNGNNGNGDGDGSGGRKHDTPAVPEPGTLGLFLTTLTGGLFFLRGRKPRGR